MLTSGPSSVRSPLGDRRSRRLIPAVLLAAAMVAGSCTSSDGWERAAPSGADSTERAAESTTCAATSADGAEAETVLDVVEAAIEDLGLGAVLVSVSRGDRDVVTAALGENVGGVPAEVDQRFFNGAVVFTYLGTMLLQLDREGMLDMDAPIDQHVDGVPGGDRITPRMLMSSTSGLADFVPMKDWVEEFYSDPFRPFSSPELEAYVYPEGLLFEPGTNVSYTHLGFRLAGTVIEAATEEPLDELLADRITRPLEMTSTEAVDSVQVPGPVLRTFTDERGEYEESTSWSPAWGVPERAMLVTDICDLRRSARGIGSGELLESNELADLLDTGTVGLGQPTDECPQCIRQGEELHLGLGVTIAGDWVIQTPSFTGFAGVQAYLPEADLAIAVANSFGPDGDVGANASVAILAELARTLTPDSPLPDQLG